MCTTTQHVVNIMTLKKNQHFRVRFGEREGVIKKEYSLYAFINVDNRERPLKQLGFEVMAKCHYRRH